MVEGFKVRWRVVFEGIIPIAIIMFIAWIGLIILLVLTANILELELEVGNPVLDQVLKLGSFGILSLIWLYVCYKTTMWYRDLQKRRGGVEVAG